MSVPRKCAPYMGALAAAGCAWSARGAKVGSGRVWLDAVVARQAAGRNGRCASTGGFRTLQFKPHALARLWLVNYQMSIACKSCHSLQERC